MGGVLALGRATQSIRGFAKGVLQLVMDDDAVKLQLFLIFLAYMYLLIRQCKLLKHCVMADVRERGKGDEGRRSRWNI